MMHKITIAGVMLAVFLAKAQEKDSATLISTVTIDAYRKPDRLLQSTKSVSVANSTLLQQNAPDRMLEAINLMPGAKMEERSPGSYRLSVRGSTLRSPFGIRNVKVYLDDFSLTDASGNTYLNMIDPQLLQSIELYKGPEAGDFGSGTGGTALLKTDTPRQRKAGIQGGSYNHFKGALHITEPVRRHFLKAYTSYETSQSYREQAALERKFVFLKDRMSYGGANEVRAMLLVSDLSYETPGGLTFAQMNDNRKQARPGTAKLPGAVQQQAGIYNKMIFAGISNLIKINENFTHFLAVQGNYHDLRNPFITNYEKRFENNKALRTHLNFEQRKPEVYYQTRVGFEGASGTYRHRNFANNSGQPSAPQTFDDITVNSGFIFLSQKVELQNRFFLDASASLNMMNYEWKRLYPDHEMGSKRFANSFLPTLGVSYKVQPDLIVRAKISKGNSAPTTEEVRSSAQQINTELQPEYGWNKEIGVRKQFGNFLFAEISLFDFRLEDAIVRRQNEAGEEYFVNAGKTAQKGVEFLVETKKINFNSTVINDLKVYISGNFYDFKFKEYRQNNVDYSGNKLTGVPATSLQGLLRVGFFENFSLDLVHFYTSSMPLNDANTVSADEALIGNAALTYSFKNKQMNAEIRFAVQNLYNTEYSLGYDINAFGNRFYNPAALRNFMLGIAVQL